MEKGALAWMFLCSTVYVLILQTSAENGPLSNAGTRFHLASLHSDGLPEEQLKIFVSSPENHEVRFNVQPATSVQETHTVPVSSTCVVALPASQLVTSEEDRDKGVMVYSEDGVSRLIVAVLVNSSDGIKTDIATVFPSHTHPSNSYTYFSVSATEAIRNGFYEHFVLLVGSEDYTSVTLTPTQSVTIPSDLRQQNCPVQLMPGSSCSFTLHSQETLLLTSSDDLSGSKIVSDSPLSVFSGHQCAAIPYGFGRCKNQIIEQIPPTTTWGKTFLVGPLTARNIGEFYKVVGSAANTNIRVYCSQQGNNASKFDLSIELNREGSTHSFAVSDHRHCSIKADKPVLLVLLAPNTVVQDSNVFVGAFMSLVPPIGQYVNSYTMSIPPTEEISVTVTIPAEFCNNSNCSIVRNGNIDSFIFDAIHCPQGTVCGYTLSFSFSSVSTTSFRLKDSPARMGIISYTPPSRGTSYGTVAEMQLNQIAVQSPEVRIRNGERGFSKKAGENLVVTCSVEITEVLSSEIELSIAWYQGNTHLVNRTVVVDPQSTDYTLQYSNNKLALNDSGSYVCEANLTSPYAGVLATTLQTTTIQVSNPVSNVNIQLLLIGVTDCNDWRKPSGDTDKTELLAQKVTESIEETCGGCGFSQEFITEPVLWCAGGDDEVVFRARVKVGGENMLSEEEVVSYLEEVRTGSLIIEGVYLTFDPKCSVRIDSFEDDFCTSQSLSSSGGLQNGGSDNGSVVTIALAVTVSLVVLMVALAVIITIAVLTTRNGSQGNLRPRSIHLHQRGSDAGESVISFSSGGSGGSKHVLNLYSPAHSTTSSTSLISRNGLSQNGYCTPSSREVDTISEDKESEEKESQEEGGTGTGTGGMSVGQPTPPRRPSVTFNL